MFDYVKIVIVAGVLFLGIWRSLRSREGTGLQRIDFATLFITVLLSTLLVVLFSSLGEVSAGYRGVVLQFGAATGEVKPEGLYFINPFTSSIEPMNVQTLSYYTEAEGSAQDNQTVVTKATLSYRLDPTMLPEIYRTLRNDHENRIIAPAMQEAMKVSTASFPAERLAVDRLKVKEKIESLVKPRFESFHIIVDAVTVVDYDFTPEWKNAINEKVVAEQRALQAKNDLERIRIEVQQQIVKAEADATTIKMRGEAEAITIKIRGEAVEKNPLLIQLEIAQRWDGKLPQFMMGEGTPLINIPSVTSRP